MCGLFGYITRTGKGPDIRSLRLIAKATESRGRHAFGLVWLDSAGKLSSYKRPGAASDDLWDLERCEGAALVLGHCRWATHGSYFDNANNHPHVAGNGLYVHNGVVRNYDRLARVHGLRLETECDSEVLGKLVARSSGTVEERITRAVSLAEGPLALLAAWANPTRLVFAKRGNPLWCGRSRNGLYFGSLPNFLPGIPRSVKEDTVRTVVYYP